MTDHYDRCISIVLYGFLADPASVADFIDLETDSVIRIGDQVGKRSSDRNRITWRQSLFADTPWSIGFQRLVERLGGLQNVKSILERLNAPHAWVRVNLPSIDSPWQESGGFNKAVIGQLAELGLSFDISIFAYDPSRPSHRIEFE